MRQFSERDGWNLQGGCKRVLVIRIRAAAPHELTGIIWTCLNPETETISPCCKMIIW